MRRDGEQIGEAAGVVERDLAELAGDGSGRDIDLPTQRNRCPIRPTTELLRAPERPRGLSAGRARGAREFSGAADRSAPCGRL